MTRKAKRIVHLKLIMYSVLRFPLSLLSQPKPVLEKPDEVLVKVKAAAINPVDYKLPMFMVGGKPIGLDFSGVVRSYLQELLLGLLCSESRAQNVKQVVQASC